MLYDVVIIGSGAAGMSAAIYTRRKELKTLIITMDVGGQTLLATELENYPGFTEKIGMKLMKTMEQQVRNLGAEYAFGKVTSVEKKGKCFVVSTADGNKYESKTLIIAIGKVPRMLGIEGEEKFYGKGVSVCATCDAPVFVNKKVAVIGGGNSAVDAAELLSKFADKVYIIHRRDEYRADERAIQRMKNNEKIEEVLSHVPVKIKGNNLVESLVVKDVKTEEEKELKVDGVFIEIGYRLDTEFLKELVDTNESGEIIVDNQCRTTCPGVFAAGDVTDVPYKQTIIAAGQGAMEGKISAKTDWCGE